MNKDLHTDPSHQAELEANFLAHIGYEHTKLILEELDREEAYIRDMVAPESLDQWFADFLKQEKKRKRRKERYRRFYSYGRWAAAIIILLVGINFLLVANVEAYRVQWLNMFTSLQKKFTQIDLMDEADEPDAKVPENWVGNYYLTYLPAGYRLTDSLDQESVIAIIYTETNGKQIIFSQFDQSSSTRIDSESGEVTKIMMKDNQEAFYLYKEGTSMLSWTTEETAFQICGDVDRQELVKMAESLMLKK